MKTIILTAAIAAVMTFVSCSMSENEVLNTSESELSIQTNFSDVVSKAAISAFPDRAALGLFITSGNLGSAYNDVVTNTNVKSVYNSGIWSQTPSVYLSPASATVFAYYPYQAANTNGLSIPIEHTTQTDYLFGTHSVGQTTVNNGNPNVALTMKHALSLLQFQISKGTYTGAGILTKIEITNKSGKTALFSEATMNIATGTITNTTNKNQSAVVNLSSALPVTTSVLVLPTSTVAAGDIQINFTIDGKTYVFSVPTNTKWEQAKKNIYTVTLNGTDLIINNVGIEDWISGNNGNVTLQ